MIEHFPWSRRDGEYYELATFNDDELRAGLTSVHGSTSDKYPYAVDLQDALAKELGLQRHQVDECARGSGNGPRLGQLTHAIWGPGRAETGTRGGTSAPRPRPGATIALPTTGQAGRTSPTRRYRTTRGGGRPASPDSSNGSGN